MSTGPTAPKKKSATISRPPRQKGARWDNQDLDEEEALLPNSQARNEPSDEEDDHVSTKVGRLAQEFPNLADEKMNKEASMDALQQLALIVRSADIDTWEALIDMTDLERDLLMKTMSAGQAQLVRRMIATKQPRTQAPKPAKPQFPEVNVGSAIQNLKSDWEKIGRGLMPSQEAANYFTKLQYEAAATEPPFIPNPSPDLKVEPWTPHALDVKRAIEADLAKQKKYGAKKHYARADHMALALIRAIIAGEVAGA